MQRLAGGEGNAGKCRLLHSKTKGSKVRVRSGGAQTLEGSAPVQVTTITVFAVFYFLRTRTS